MNDHPLRFTRGHTCPVCGGHDGLARGRGKRCFGYLDATGGFARCTREERAGSLEQNRDGTYSHRLQGDCRCGRIHGEPGVPTTQARPKPRRTAGAVAFRSFFTLAASLRRLHGEGSAVTSWAYHNADGREAFRILRVDYRDDAGARAKTYRPCHRGGDGRWRLSGPGGLLPLYNLPGILASSPGRAIPILEGEKCADIARALGLADATTSAHGAGSPRLTDWTPLAGRRVAILRDEGERGIEYAAKVAAILCGLRPPADVRVVRLPGLTDGQDIEQWAAGRRRGGLTDGEIADELISLMAAAFA